MIDVNNEIVRTIDLNAPVERVWQAIVDAKQFGQWFKCTVSGEFAVGQVVNCSSLYEGNEQSVWQKLITAIEPEKYFAFEWSPGETGADLYSEQAGKTLVEFTLRASGEMGEGCQLVIRESGFASLPADAGRKSFELNTHGWDAQVGNITTYVES